MTAKLKGGDKAKAYLERLIRNFSKNTQIHVGFYDGATYPDGTPVAAVAAWNEFGTDKTPPRPFMRPTIQDHKSEWAPVLAAELKASDYDTKRAMNVLAEHIAGQVQETIIDCDSPPNSPVTNLLKQRFPRGVYSHSDYLQALKDIASGVSSPAGKPLVWSGTLLNDVKGEVVDD